MTPIRRREVFRPSRATADRAACGRGAPQESAGAGNVPERSGGKIRRSRTRRVRKHPRAPHLRPHAGSALTECAGRGMPPPLAEPARGGGMTGDGLAPDGNLAIAERGEDAARRPPPRAGEVAAAFPAPRHTHTHTHHTPHAYTSDTVKNRQPRSDRLNTCRSEAHYQKVNMAFAREKHFAI